MKPSIQKAWAAVAMLCLSIPAFAYDFEADGYYFNITDEANKEVEVTYKDTSYGSYSGVANIPEKVSCNGSVYTVTAIGESAFCNCKGLLSVTIPNTVTTIGEKAFYSTNLQSVTMGAALTDIYVNAFSRDIPKVIWLCNTLPNVVGKVSAWVNYVSNNQFELYNQKVYPFLSSKFEVDGVVYVPVSPSDRTCDVIDCNYAPTNTEIEIDEFVVNKGVELKVLDVNNYSFYGNDEITSLSANNNGYIGNNSFDSCVKIKELSLGNGITTIGQSAFEDCSALPTVTIPDNVSSIGESIFSGCSALESVHIGRGLGIIPEYAFKNCALLKSLSIPNNLGL